MNAQLTSTSWYGWKTAAVATLFHREGTNVIAFDTSTNTNFLGIGFMSTEEIKLAEDKLDLNLMSFNIRQDTDSGEKVNIHRHGGNVVSLSKLLGHSSLDITQNYINLLVSDIAHQVDEFNVLDKFYGREHIQIKRGKFNGTNKGER